LGYQVLEAQNLEAAKRWIKDNPRIDFIYSDKDFPSTNSAFELLDFISDDRKFPNLYMVIVTGANPSYFADKVVGRLKFIYEKKSGLEENLKNMNDAVRLMADLGVTSAATLPSPAGDAAMMTGNVERILSGIADDINAHLNLYFGFSLEREQSFQVKRQKASNVIFVEYGGSNKTDFERLMNKKIEELQRDYEIKVEPYSPQGFLGITYDFNGMSAFKLTVNIDKAMMMSKENNSEKFFGSTRFTVYTIVVALLNLYILISQYLIQNDSFSGYHFFKERIIKGVPVWWINHGEDIAAGLGQPAILQVIGLSILFPRLFSESNWRKAGFMGAALMTVVYFFYEIILQKDYPDFYIELICLVVFFMTNYFLFKNKTDSAMLNDHKEFASRIHPNDSSEPGGIDLNLLDISTQGTATPVQAPLNPAMLQKPLNLTPRIIHIGTVNVYDFLGLSSEETKEEKMLGS